MTDTISTFIHTNHKEDSPKLRMLSFIPQRQRIQMDFILDTIRFLMHTKANRDNADSGVFPFKLYTKSTLQTTKSYALCSAPWRLSVHPERYNKTTQKLAFAFLTPLPILGLL